MARKKATEVLEEPKKEITYTYRLYGTSKREEISYEDALAMVKKVFPKDAKDMLNICNRIQCDKGEIETTVDGEVLMTGIYNITK